MIHKRTGIIILGIALGAAFEAHSAYSRLANALRNPNFYKLASLYSAAGLAGGAAGQYTGERDANFDAALQAQRAALLAKQQEQAALYTQELKDRLQDYDLAREAKLAIIEKGLQDRIDREAKERQMQGYASNIEYNLGKGSPLARSILGNKEIGASQYTEEPVLGNTTLSGLRKFSNWLDSEEVAEQLGKGVLAEHKLHTDLMNAKKAELLKQNIAQQGGWKAWLGKPFGIGQITPEQQAEAERLTAKEMDRQRKLMNAARLRALAKEQQELGDGYGYWNYSPEQIQGLGRYYLKAPNN